MPKKPKGLPFSLSFNLSTTSTDELVVPKKPKGLPFSLSFNCLLLVPMS